MPRKDSSQSGTLGSAKHKLLCTLAAVIVIASCFIGHNWFNTQSATITEVGSIDEVDNLFNSENAICLFYARWSPSAMIVKDTLIKLAETESALADFNIGLIDIENEQVLEHFLNNAKPAISNSDVGVTGSGETIWLFKGKVVRLQSLHRVTNDEILEISLKAKNMASQ